MDCSWQKVIPATEEYQSPTATRQCKVFKKSRIAPDREARWKHESFL